MIFYADLRAVPAFKKLKAWRFEFWRITGTTVEPGALETCTRKKSFEAA
jgi:hypothetical protein